MSGWIKMPLGVEVDLGPGDFVLDGDPALPSPKKGTEPPPQFSAHVYYSYCGFVRTLHNRYWFAQVQFLFLEKV